MSDNQSKTWYYIAAENERIGPVSITDLSALAGQGKLTPETLVWSPEHPNGFPLRKSLIN